MSNDRLKYLLGQYAADVSTPEETKELFGWIKKSKDDALLKEKIKELWSGHKNSKQLPDVDWDVIYTKIINTPAIKQKPVWFRVAAAAIILILSVGSYVIFNDHSIQPIAATQTQEQPKFENDLAPGGNKAVLTLANGAQIILDSAGNGALTQQGNTNIIKLNNGQLSYNSLNEKPGQILYNTISTPRGGQYQVVLSDGSKVWLNAASSLRFPTSFTGVERNVELTGEGYFEVAPLTNKGGHGKTPFIVSVNGAEIEVLGTHFNINAYNDEATIKTTLLEGSVRVGNASASKTIRPGEQAQIENRESSKIMVQAVDVDAVIAWKNGRFIFHGNNIQSVMRQLARWYNVDVSYAGNVTDEEFVGVINRSRYENISEILAMLEKTRTVSFAVDGHNVTVMPFKK